MTDDAKQDLSRTGDVACADDVPKFARLLARQRFLAKWYKAVALAPFALMLFIIHKFFPNTNGGLGLMLIVATLGWAIAVAGYSLYLNFVLRCPVCNSRYGMGRELPFLRIAETSGINRADFSSKFSVSDGLSQHLPNHAPHSLRHHPIDHMRSHLTGPLPSCLVFRSSR